MRKVSPRYGPGQCWRSGTVESDAGPVDGPDAWDGYRAAVVSQKKATRQRLGADCTGEPMPREGKFRYVKILATVNSRGNCRTGRGRSAIDSSKLSLEPGETSSYLRRSNATYLAKVKSAGIQILEKGSDTAICVGLTEVGRLFDDGWHMTPEEWRKIKSGDLVIIHQDSGECRPARFVTGAHFFTAKVIFEGETELSSVAARKIGAV